MICDPKKCRKEIILNHHHWFCDVLWAPRCPAGIIMSTVSAIRLECAGFLSDAIVSKLVGGCIPTIFFVKNVFKYLWKQSTYGSIWSVDIFLLWYGVEFDLYDTMIWTFSNIGLAPNHPKLDIFSTLKPIVWGLNLGHHPLFTIISHRWTID